MIGHENDPVVQRAVDELRRLPPMDHAAVERIAAAAAAARLTPADPVVEMPRRRARRWLTVGIAAAAAVVGFIARDLVPVTPHATTDVAQAPTPAVAAAPMRAAASTNADVALVPQPFVLENRAAHRVAVVGDFNNWNPRATAMTRSSDGALWSVIVPIVPGRHVYGFMVDDSVFTLDPRTTSVRDPDFGTNASVLMVGRP